MPAVQETIDRVRSIDLDQYKYGFETTIEMEKSAKGISEDEAYALLRRTAMNKNRKITEIAQSLVTAADLLGDGP